MGYNFKVTIHSVESEKELNSILHAIALLGGGIICIDGDEYLVEVKHGKNVKDQER